LWGGRVIAYETTLNSTHISTPLAFGG
jgi:hypothetical protein